MICALGNGFKIATSGFRQSSQCQECNSPICSRMQSLPCHLTIVGYSLLESVQVQMSVAPVIVGLWKVGVPVDGFRVVSECTLVVR